MSIYNTYNMSNSRQAPGAGYPGLPTLASPNTANPVQVVPLPLWKQPSVRPEIVNPATVQYNNTHGQYRYDSTPTSSAATNTSSSSTSPSAAAAADAAAAAAQYHLQYAQYGQQQQQQHLDTTLLHQQQQVHWQQQQQQHHQHQLQQQHHPHHQQLQHQQHYNSRHSTSSPDMNTSLFQVFDNSTAPPSSSTSPSTMTTTTTQEPHFLYCKKCALLKPAVEFASTTGFFNNNCKHCRNYRRKGEDAKSEAVQEIYRVGSYEQLKSTVSDP